MWALSLLSILNLSLELKIKIASFEYKLLQWAAHLGQLPLDISLVLPNMHHVKYNNIISNFMTEILYNGSVNEFHLQLSRPFTFMLELKFFIIVR